MTLDNPQPYRILRQDRAPIPRDSAITVTFSPILAEKTRRPLTVLAASPDEALKRGKDLFPNLLLAVEPA